MKSENSLEIKFDINSSEQDEKTQKINEMLDKYFKLPNGNHLFINYVEFRNYLYTLNEIDEEIKISQSERDSRYNHFYEQINNAKIYPGKYNPKIFNFNYFIILCSLHFLLYSFIFIPLFLKKTNITNFFIYIIGVIAIFINIYFIGFFSIKKFEKEHLIKLIKILNAKPSLELYYNKECIFNIPFHSYADVTGIQCINNSSPFNYKNEYNIVMESLNLNKILFLDFPLKYLFFVDSTLQYFKFLILQFNKYCYLDSNRNRDIYEKMYLKFCLHTSDNEIIYRNDPFFFTSFTTMNLYCYYTLLIISIFTLTSPLFYLINNYICKKKIIEIKKTVSIKHDLENYLNLDALFLKIITKIDINVEREKHEVISDKDSIQNEFIQDCVKITEKTREKNNSPLELKGKLVPYAPSTGFIKSKWSMKEFDEQYGTKVEKILGKKIVKIFVSLSSECSNDSDSDDDDIDDNDNENDNEDDKKNRRFNKRSHKLETNKSLRKVIYSEKVLSIECHINKQSVNCKYNIKLPNGHNKTGKFDMKKPISNGFGNLEEKVNQDWTKSEIYIPGCVDKIIILRKKRAIRILLEDKEIITSDTILNDEIHAGAKSWLDGNDWDKRTIEQFVKKCNKISSKIRFKTQYV